MTIANEKDAKNLSGAMLVLQLNKQHCSRLGGYFLRQWLVCVVGSLLGGNLAFAAEPNVGPSPGADFAGLEQARRFWSFQPVQKIPPSRVKDKQWARNPIDQFVLAKIESQGLRPAPAATKAVLVRRIY